MKHGTKTSVRLVLVVSALTVFAVSCLKQQERISPTITSAETPDAVPQRVSDKTFKAFSHTVKEHQQFDCTSCHKREGKSLKIELPGHESCIGCHLNQFTDVEAQTMCTICHENVSGDPHLIKTFPAKFVEGFNMKFDHAVHERGSARPAQGCVACHDLAGPGRSIPAGVQAHNDCFGCHTSESKIGQCSVCHTIAPYSRTPQSRYVFKAVFTHAAHSGVNCDDCHNVRPGRQGAQVSNIVAQEHNVPSGNNCVQCHNGSRAFAGDDIINMSSCTRCHKGGGFNMLPGSPQ
jgi:hypothetical protein